jgi:hypothetical protein
MTGRLTRLIKIVQKKTQNNNFLFGFLIASPDVNINYSNIHINDFDSDNLKALLSEMLKFERIISGLKKAPYSTSRNIRNFFRFHWEF